jgi:uncharacterized Zn finger protein
MDRKERDERAARCPRCGGEAEWSFIDEDKTRVEIMCQDCGTLEMAREDFDLQLVEHPETTESERA